jgi:hypothetical protein
MEGKKSIFLKVSSHDAIINSSKGDNDFVVSATSDILQRVVGLRVRSVAFRNTFNNITDNNNKFVFDIDGVGPAVFNIPPGYYNITEFLQAVEDRLNAVPSLVGSTVVIDPFTNKITITTPVGIKWAPNDRKREQSNPLSDILGFNPYQTDYTSFNTIQTALGLPTLAGPINLNVYSRSLAENTYIDADSKNLLNILTSVPIHTPYGTAEIYESSSDNIDLIKYRSPRDLTTIDIRLRDNRGYLLDYSDEIVIVLELFY